MQLQVHLQIQEVESFDNDFEMLSHSEIQDALSELTGCTSNACAAPHAHAMYRSCGPLRYCWYEVCQLKQ